MTNDIESKPFSFMTDTLKWSSVETKGGVDQYVEGYITTDDPDLDDDIVTQKGLNKVFEQLTQQDIMLDLEHDTYRDEEGIPRARAMNNIAIGRIVDKRKDEHGVWVKAKLNPYVQSFKSVWESIKAGFIKAFSITFKTVASRTKTVGDTTYRLIDDLNILNVALTSCPINPKATFIPAFKSYIKNNTQPEEKSSVEETKMTDEEKIETPAEKPTEEEPKEETTEETKEEPEQKSEPEVKPEESEEEEKEDNSEEMKALNKKLDAVTAELKSLKADVEKPVLKSTVDKEKPLKMKSTYVGPLDLVK